VADAGKAEDPGREKTVTPNFSAHLSKILQHTALILAGHGSTQNADSSRFTRETAKRLGKRRIFKEVRAGFWKESPSFQEVFHGLEAKEAIVVPWFLTRGYFVEKVLAEQFASTPIPVRVVEPIGSRPEIVDLVRARAERLRRAQFKFKFKLKKAIEGLLGISKSDRSPCTQEAGRPLRGRPSGVFPGSFGFAVRETSLLLASHGTPLHKGSRVAADGLAEELGKDGYRVAKAMFLEEEPKIADWRQVAAPEGPVMVLPHFLAGGLHGSEDVPGLLGIPHGREGWHRVDGRWIGYGAPIGQPEEMESLILRMLGCED
jgi:sirohydrochlorin cobaltochelatase